jgi:hypothetical protein
MISAINRFRAARRVLAGFFIAAAALLAAPRDAHAVYKFCANINPVYVDSGNGEDNLGGLVTAAFHYMEVTFNGVTSSGYSDANGCLATTFSGAGTYLHGIYPKVRLGTSTTTIYEKRNTAFTGLAYTWSNLPASTGSAVTEKRSTISGTTLDHLYRVSAVVEFVTAAAIVVNTSYTIYARVPAGEAGGCVACVQGNVMTLSSEPSNPNRWTNQQKGVIAHEFGHFSQKDLFGYFGQQNGQQIIAPTDSYCAPVTEDPCECNFVTASPPSSFCGGEQIDRLHCLNSREYLFGAFPEGYAHLIATITLNNTSQGAAIFPYYKHLVSADGTTFDSAPVPHQVLPSPPYAWMDTVCPTAAAGRATEMDWLGFLYHVNTQGTNRYSFTEIQTLMTNAAVCAGVCTDADKVTYLKMVQAVDAQTWSAGKKNHFKSFASAYGVNH